MPRGRPPKPIESRRIVGRTAHTDSGGRRLPVAREITVTDAVAPGPPNDLGERGSAEWVKIWAAGSAWLAPNIDYPWIEMVCRAYDDIEAFRGKIQADGLIQKGSMGQVVSHPLIQSVRQAEGTIQRCLSILGFSPTDRARLGLVEVKRESKLQSMMNRAISD